MIDVESYCRDIEAYLCRKNDGHLIRITGAAFEQVQGWARQGVPLKIAEAGIDRYFERYYRKGPRRRPVRIEFCEADVLDAFDDWRRALGVTGNQVSEAAPSDEWTATARKGSLGAHIDRVLSRLVAVRTDRAVPGFDAAVARITAELDGLSQHARRARGEARERAIARLAELDREVIDAARTVFDAAASAALQEEADDELASFAGRMTAAALAHARQRAFERLLRDRLNLPVLSYE